MICALNKQINYKYKVCLCEHASYSIVLLPCVYLCLKVHQPCPLEIRCINRNPYTYNTSITDISEHEMTLHKGTSRTLELQSMIGDSHH